MEKSDPGVAVYISNNFPGEVILMQVYSSTDKKAFPSETIGAALLVMIYLGLIVFALWASNKGRNIMDKGFYLLQAQYPDFGGQGYV